VRGWGRIKNIASAAIGRNRRSTAVRGLHALAAFVESAYANDGSSFANNGEQTLLRKLDGAGFRIAFDVGANFGDWLLEGLSVWPQCRVHAFEVAPWTFEELQRRVKALPYADRAVLQQAGVSDREGTEIMHFFPDHPEVTCDMPRHSEYRSEQFEARMVTLDRYCERNDITAIDFLKIDVEGAEYKVLKGAAGLLAGRRVHTIQFEYGAFSTQTHFLLGDYYSLLAGDYWIGKIYPGYVDFREYQWTMEDFRFSNYCCVSRSRPDLRSLVGADFSRNAATRAAQSGAGD
jgi:FkbM family methyltransferase